MKLVILFALALVACSSQELNIENNAEMEKLTECEWPLELGVNGECFNPFPTTTCTPACEEGYECYGRGCIKICNNSDDCSSDEMCINGSLGRDDYLDWVSYCEDKDLAEKMTEYKCKTGLPCLEGLRIESEYNTCTENSDCILVIPDCECQTIALNKENIDKYNQEVWGNTYCDTYCEDNSSDKFKWSTKCILNYCQKYLEGVKE